jgi:GNAT superfamily N-acetyltransferase
MTGTTVVRAGRNADDAGFIALIGACWAEYPSIVYDVDAELPELHALASYYQGKGGALWAAEADATVVGMVAVAPHDGDTWEICRMYVARPWRGGGLAHQLLDTAEEHARAAGASELVLWSDTRFDRAHRFYENRSYVRRGPVRALHDLSYSLEFGYAKPMNGVERLDAAAADSAKYRLAELLAPSLMESRALGFLPRLEREAARAFWHRCTAEIALGKQILIGGWRDGVLAGCAMVNLETTPDQAHRAEVQGLVVHRDMRGRGLRRALLYAVEAEAAGSGRWLLTMRTRADNLVAALRCDGWTESGRLPEYARNADSSFDEAVVLYKRLSVSMQGD